MMERVWFWICFKSDVLPAVALAKVGGYWTLEIGFHKKVWHT